MCSSVVCLTPCDLGLLLGNRAWTLSRAELCTAQHRWCQSANLSGGIGGWTLVRNIWCYPGWKPLEAQRERQRQSRVWAVLSSLLLFLFCVRGAFPSEAAAVFQHGKSVWGERLRRGEGLTDSPNRGADYIFVCYSLWLSHTITNTHSESRVRLRPWALASRLTIAASTTGVIGQLAPTLQETQHALGGPQ